MLKTPYKILIIESSKSVYHRFAELITRCHDLHIMEPVPAMLETFPSILQTNPDVIILDITLSHLKGFTLLKYIMLMHPVPTLLLTSKEQQGTNIIFDALRYGAVDFITTTLLFNLSMTLGDYHPILQKIRLAIKIKANTIHYIRVTLNANINKTKPQTKVNLNSVAIGVAEGGCSALLNIVLHLKPHLPISYMIICYESPDLIEGLIQYLNQYTPLPIKHACHNTFLEDGVCYINSGEEYVTLHEHYNHLVAYVSPAPFSSRRGTIDMLMFSLAETCGRHALGIVLSGEGADGSEGLEEIVRVGGKAIVQSPTSCLYKSMVLSALNRCEAEVLIDTEITAEISRFYQH
jgi:two-component system, chemotaxis family, protein-glutamate methylesterase/glutaminase